MATTLTYMKDEGQFTEGSKSGENVLATLTVDDTQSTAKLNFSPDANLIVRRTASRQAENVVKSGFLLKSGERIGIGYELEVVEGDKLSDAHLREGHKYNRV